MEFEGKRVLVIGTGLSGKGATEMLSALGAKITILDQSEKAEAEKIRAGFEGILKEEEIDRLEILAGPSSGEMAVSEYLKDGKPGFDLVVPSPAVPLDSPLILKMKEAGIPVISEIELGFQNEKGRVIAITGTNGKTTTTTLVGEIMKAYSEAFSEQGKAGSKGSADGEQEAGLSVSDIHGVNLPMSDKPGVNRPAAADKTLEYSADQKRVPACSRAFVVGNIGRSYASASMDTAPDTVTVGEISSFQLEAVTTFHPVVSAILNITPDHLNRHYTMENYAAIKERIAVNQTKRDVCVLNYEDPYLRPYGEHLCPASVVWFSSADRLTEGFYLDGENICRADGRGGSQVLLNVHEMNLVGVCNAENVMAAIAMTEAAGVPMDLILSVIRKFPPVPHRIEFVAEKNGVRYYNDSKATNPDAAIQGIRAMSGPTVLIGGGYDKKNSYDEWIEAFDGKVKKLVLIGATREAIADCARAHGFEDILFCDTFEECLKTCTDLADKGDSVLLSPACASWGMFPNYEVRGDMFKEYVRSLPD